MMTIYRLTPVDNCTNQISGLLRTRDGVTCQIPLDPDNADYQEYVAWVHEGNTPDRAEQ